MLDEVKNDITIIRECEGKELFRIMKKLTNDAKGNFDKIVEGMNDEDIRNNLFGELGGVLILVFILYEKAGYLTKEEADTILNELSCLIIKPI